MSYKSTVTSKGTITIGAKLRKELNILPGQEVSIERSGNHLIVRPAVTLEQFSAYRDQVLADTTIPQHLRGLAGDKLRRASAQAWTDNT
jgi:AbrB family looped-hinge helix DNA binding protein